MIGAIRRPANCRIGFVSWHQDLFCGCLHGTVWPNNSFSANARLIRLMDSSMPAVVQKPATRSSPSQTRATSPFLSRRNNSLKVNRMSFGQVWFFRSPNNTAEPVCANTGATPATRSRRGPGQAGDAIAHVKEVLVGFLEGGG